jgi:hypothetical protein
VTALEAGVDLLAVSPDIFPALMALSANHRLGRPVAIEVLKLTGAFGAAGTSFHPFKSNGVTENVLARIASPHFSQILC